MSLWRGHRGRCIISTPFLGNVRLSGRRPLFYITESDNRIDRGDSTLIFLFDSRAGHGENRINQEHILGSHIPGSFQRAHYLFVYQFSGELPLAVNYWLLVLVSFQILTHQAIMLPLPLISKLTLYPLVSLVCLLALFLTSLDIFLCLVTGARQLLCCPSEIGTESLQKFSFHCFIDSLLLVPNLFTFANVFLQNTHTRYFVDTAGVVELVQSSRVN